MIINFISASSRLLHVFIQAEFLVHEDHIITRVNKSAQSNLGRGPRRGAVPHVRRKVSIGYNGAPQICPQKYTFPWNDPQTA